MDAALPSTGLLNAHYLLRYLQGRLEICFERMSYFVDAQNVVGEAAQPDEHTLIVRDARRVFVEGDGARIVVAIFDGPVAEDNVGEDSG
jgi:hypothetical protein